MAGVWRWILLYVLALVVLQVAVYLVARRNDGGGLGAVSGEAESRSPARTSLDSNGGEEYAGRRESADRRPSVGGQGAPDGVVRCPRCGERNDPGFRFCRRCVADLGLQ